MVSRNKGDLVAALVLGGFGAFVIYGASTLPYVSEFGPGPGFLPLWIGIGTVLFSVLLFVASISTRQSLSEEKSEFAWIEMARALGGWGALVVTIALLPFSGFTLGFGLFTAFLILVLYRRSPWIALSVALGLAAGFHLVFVFALGVSLPVGPLGF